ncbi:periplasmic chaperone for outer membrane proteins SurA [Sphaerotilus hippei]|uniref:Chaperone SurA n=1 Tax=Sphaerotilus hippei TaxID=744406 RepID=A0A318GZV6_9BURK|nr:peptidylprolyl isomerase [Sphaerotilus hippei]PXW95814.1 periplasmic chaperone for outer membrane proteins SurA [Sphaerotilus hippei]
MTVLLPFLRRHAPLTGRVPATPWRRLGRLAGLALVLGGAALAAPPDALAQRRGGDYIVAVVNQELVTNNEVQQRIARAEQEAERTSARLPARSDLQQQILDQLIDERTQLSYARDTGVKVEEAEVDRGLASIASQNQLTLAQLRERLQNEGLDYFRFRSNLRDQIALDRVREREVQARIRITDTDIENWLAEQRQRSGAATEYNLGQILIAVPENATPAQVAERRARAVQALQRLRAGESFGALVRELSDGPKERDGSLGLRRADKLPDLFVDAVRPLRTGEVAPQVLRSGAGFHVLKVIERLEAALSVQQHRARHILLRPGPQLSEAAIVSRLQDYRRRITAGTARFDDLARRNSEDGSAASGGDLGWAGPGQFVPEFQRVLEQLNPGDLSEPVVSRFGVHLIQLMERREVRLDVREQREAARNALREQKYEEAYLEWARELRARAYVELREQPGQ